MFSCKQNSYIPLENSIEVDYCFGLVLNHCDEPLSLDFYVQVPARNITVQQRITHDTHLPISGEYQQLVSKAFSLVLNFFSNSVDIVD